MEFLVASSGASRGERYPLLGEQFHLGRDSSCEIPIDDPSSSRRHARLFRRQERWFIGDLGSTNGTFVNDRRITETPLVHGDKISIGNIVLLFEYSPQGEPAPGVTVRHHPDELNTTLHLREPGLFEISRPRADAKLARLPAVQAGRLEFIYDFMVDVAGLLNISRLCSRVLERVFSTLRADRGVVLLFDKDNQLRQTALRVRREERTPREIHVSRRMLSYVIETGEALLSSDPATDGRFSSTAVIRKEQINSVMCVPLRSHDRMMGVLYLDTVGIAEPFAPEDLRFLLLLAAPTGLAIENARLHEQSLDFAEYTESIMRCLQSGVLVVDADGRVAKMNEAAAGTIGLTPEELLGSKLTDHERLRGLAAIIDEAQQTNEVTDRREVVVRVGAEEIPLEVSAAPLRDRRGSHLGVVTNFRSLYVLKQLSARARRAEHMAELGSMAAGVAPEVRNPLNAMQGFAQLLTDRLGGDQTSLEYVQVITDEINHVNEIVRDLLDFARPREFTLVALDVRQVVENALGEITFEIEEAEVKVQRSFSAKTPRALANPEKLRQVFANIIRNAVQAMAGGGTLTISTALRRPDPPASGETEGPALSRREPDQTARSEVIVSFSDTGPGMARDVQARIFQPFFTTKGSGTGLGLAICQRIIERHAGRIEIRSAPGKGSTFSVILPVRERPLPVKGPPAKQAGPPGPKEPPLEPAPRATGPASPST